jgi:hypothetical protein
MIFGYFIAVDKHKNVIKICIVRIIFYYFPVYVSYTIYYGVGEKFQQQCLIRVNPLQLLFDMCKSY